MEPSDNEPVGYRRPPKRTQWKKGQSGNPGNKNRTGKRSKKIWRIIEEIFSEEVNIIEDGVTRRTTVFQAILLQLLIKTSKGNRRALRVLMKYEAYAREKPEYYFRTEEDMKGGAEEFVRLINSFTLDDEFEPSLTPIEADERFRALLND